MPAVPVVVVVPKAVNVLVESVVAVGHVVSMMSVVLVVQVAPVVLLLLVVPVFPAVNVEQAVCVDLALLLYARTRFFHPFWIMDPRWIGAFWTLFTPIQCATAVLKFIRHGLDVIGPTTGLARKIPRCFVSTDLRFRRWRQLCFGTTAVHGQPCTWCPLCRWCLWCFDLFVCLVIPSGCRARSVCGVRSVRCVLGASGAGGARSA